MKQFIHAVSCALTVCGFLLLGASCSKENEPVQTVEGVTVTIAAQSDLQTRTSLPVYDGDYGNNIRGVQHVTDVYLYIYEMAKLGPMVSVKPALMWGGENTLELIIFRMKRQ